jgi:hypothetical protein
VLIETETSVIVRLSVTTAVVGTRRVISRVETLVRSRVAVRSSVAVLSRVAVFSRVLVRSNVSVRVGPGRVFSIVGPGGPETVFVTETKFVRVMVCRTSERYVEIETTVVPGTVLRQFRLFNSFLSSATHEKL